MTDSVTNNELRFVLRRLVESVIYWMYLALTMLSVGAFVGCMIVLALKYFSYSGSPTPEEAARYHWFIRTIMVYPWTSALACLVTFYATWSVQAGISVSTESYKFTTAAPSFKIHKCTYCKKELDKSNNFTCNHCHALAPLGACMFFVRLVSALLTVLNYAIMIALFLSFIFVYR